MPLRDDLLKPIPGANPSGANLRYDPVLDEIKEARREEFEAPQGAWKTAFKTADYGRVIQLAGEVLATRSKDLQVAAWLVDAHVRRDGFRMLPECFRFLEELCTQFWETLYPEIEDGELETRAAPLVSLGSRLSEPVRLLPLTKSGLSWFRYRESRDVGYDAQPFSNDQRKKREQDISEGKLTADAFDLAVNETPKELCEQQLAQIEKSLVQLKALSAFLDEKFSPEPPSFLPVKQALEEIAVVIRGFVEKKGGPASAEAGPRAADAGAIAAPAAQPPNATETAPPAKAAAPVPKTPPVQRAAESGGMEPADFADAVKRVSAVARFLRARDVYDVAPYLMLRALRWGEIRYGWPDLDNAQLIPPDQEMRNELASTLAAAQWDRVLALAEEAMELPCGRAWLDLQRYTVRALEGKGKWFNAVANAIRGALRSLLEDMPKLLEASLRDGSPAADAETRDWIEREILGAAQARRTPEVTRETEAAPVALTAALVVSTPPAPSMELTAKPLQIENESLAEEAGRDAFEQALRAAKDGQMNEALMLLQRELASERSGRARFRRRVQLAHLLVAAGRPQVAQPILDEVAEEIESRRLEEWEEREALAYPLSLLLRCADGDAEKRCRLYSAICRLDPARALAISS